MAYAGGLWICDRCNGEDLIENEVKEVKWGDSYVCDLCEKCFDEHTHYIERNLSWERTPWLSERIYL